MASAFLAELVKLINQVRTNPTSYVEKILDYKKYFKGKTFRLPEAKVETITDEGFAAYEAPQNF